MYQGRPLTRVEERTDLLLQAVTRCNWLRARLLDGPECSLVDLNYFASRLKKWSRIRDSLYRLLSACSTVEYGVHGPDLFAQPVEVAA